MLESGPAREASHRKIDQEMRQFRALSRLDISRKPGVL